ncbi:MAG: hypothetical protein Q8O99_05860 [bacterium]|nr:hypothetical protein [bacterium]
MTPTSLISLLYTAQQLAAIQDMYRKYQETFDRLVTYISELKSNEATLRLKKNIAAILLGHPITDTDLSQQNSTL